MGTNSYPQRLLFEKLSWISVFLCKMFKYCCSRGFSLSVSAGDATKKMDKSPFSPMAK